MSIISIPYTFSAGAVIIAAQHNSNFSTIYSDYCGNIDNTNIANSAGIVYSKLNLTGSILNADLAGSIADTKLNQITTAGKVSGTAITGLASLPSGAGVIPTANLPALNPHGSQIFTSSGTFTAPTGITKVFLTGIGAGAGGGGATSGNMGGGGGSGAYIINYPYTVIAGNSYTVTLNNGGAGGIGASNGSDGGTTVFDSLTLLGGSGGVNGSSTTSNGGAGALGQNIASNSTTVANSAITNTGNSGWPGSRGDNGNQYGGNGGDSPFGKAFGQSGQNSTGSTAPVNTGVGGSGSWSNSSSQTGGAGAKGFILVQY